jgi:3-oxoacyl-[acyl-carrier protein] reductase
MTRDWPSCRALVTGGRRGLGRAYAEELAGLGVRVRVTSRSPSAPDELRWDLDDPTSTRALLDELGEVELLVHAAHAFAPHVPMVALRAEELSASLQRNVVVAYDLLRGVCRRMARAGFGRVLILGSLAATAGGVGQTVYIVEKAALAGMARAFSAELAPRGVLVNVVHPAIVDTENVRQRVRPELLEIYRRRAPGGRLLAPLDVVRATLGLLDPRQQGMTGQSVCVTGGVDSGAAWLVPDGDEP